MLRGHMLLALGVLMGSVPPVAAPARVARTSLGEMARSADVVAIARVESVPTCDGLPVARAVPLKVLKGRLDPGPFHFIAGPTWSCDMSAAVRGETALFLLDAATSDQFSRKGRRQPTVRVPIKPLYTLTLAGRGRMPLRMVAGQPHFVLPLGVDPPSTLRPVVADGEATAPRDQVLVSIRQALGDPAPRRPGAR